MRRNSPQCFSKSYHLFNLLQNDTHAWLPSYPYPPASRRMPTSSHAHTTNVHHADDRKGEDKSCCWMSWLVRSTLWSLISSQQSVNHCLLGGFTPASIPCPLSSHLQIEREKERWTKRTGKFESYQWQYFNFTVRKGAGNWEHVTILSCSLKPIIAYLTESIQELGIPISDVTRT